MESLEKLTNKEQKELLDLINLKTEIEQLNTYLINNSLPFCINHCEMPFNISYSSIATLVRLIEMIKSGNLILKK
jgi:hypothetical protein